MKVSEKKTNDSSSNDVAHLLWTGGWDSTFRLLQLIYDENRKVQPHYIIRPQECTGKEIDTIHDISREILNSDPEIRKLILPVNYYDVEKIEEDEEITKEYKRIAEKKYISLQYEILARYGKQIGNSSLELSVLSSETFDYFRSTSTIFQYFEFPLLGLTKPEMAEIAEKKGWGKIMEMTWFCRRPHKGRPCGFCGPCTDAVIAGMGWRLPLKARIIAAVQIPFRKWWRNNYNKQDQGVLQYIPHLLKGKY